MLDKLKALWGNVNENWFAAAVGVIAYVVSEKFSSPELVMTDILAIKLTYVAMLLGASFGLFYFLKGTAFDVMREIFEEQNAGAALLAVGYLVAIALVLGA